MVGTSPDSQGGVAAVVSVLKKGGLLKRCGVAYICSHRDGSTVAKLLTAAKGSCQLLERLLQRRVTLVHIHMSSRASFWRKLVFFIWPVRLFSVPYLIHLHGGRFNVFYGDEGSNLRRRLIRGTFARARMIVVLSDEWADWARTTFPDAHVTVIHNPVVIPETASTPALSQNIVFMGHIGQKKGVDDLLEAFAKTQTAYPGSKLIIAGSGNIEQARELARKLKISAEVTFPGWIRGRVKQNLLAGAGIYALPSYHEGLPMSLLEAMAAGLPVIATPVGGIPKAITDDVHGFLINPGDVQALASRLGQLLSDSALRTQMGVAAREKAKDIYAVGGIIKQWESLYKQMCQSEQ